jgi:AmmeMemoRadiSam system protein B
VAGSFYPADGAELRDAVEGYLAAAAADSPLSSPASAPKAIVVPHAGYVYSAPVAAAAYARLAPGRRDISRVVLIGPAHTCPLAGVATSTADAFATPLGEVPIDAEMRAAVLALPQVVALDEAHAGEHSLEVQLPFLQCVLERFSMLPLVAGSAGAAQVAEVIGLVWNGPSTLVVVSSDLSHYHDYATAQRLDQHTARAIERLDAGALDTESACGRAPIRALLLAARARGLQATTLDLRSSGDTAGPRDRVVGYGAFAFVAQAPTPS